MAEILFYDCIIIGAGAAGLFCAAGAPAASKSRRETGNCEKAAAGSAAKTKAGEKAAVQSRENAEAFGPGESQGRLENEAAGSREHPENSGETNIQSFGFRSKSAPSGRGLILEGTDAPGKKLLLSGSGQCNITHGGSIKDFVTHYGPNGRKIRSALYRFNNLALAEFFQSRGIPLQEREDGKVFPKSMKASDILDALLAAADENGYRLLTGSKVRSIEAPDDGTFLVNGQYRTGKLVIAAGGCSVPVTGSDGSIFPILEKLGLLLTERAPALVPVYVQDYPYSALSGISFPRVRVSIGRQTLQDDLLLTHRGFSGPAVLNLSRYAKTGSVLRIDYLPEGLPELSLQGNRRQAAAYFAETLNLPRRFVESLLKRVGIDSQQTAASIAGKKFKAFTELLKNDTFSVSGCGGFQAAMATRGGVALSEVDLKTFQCKKFPGLFVIGETLDIDGDTGGYNLQFAFSSGRCAASE